VGSSLYLIILLEYGADLMQRGVHRFEKNDILRIVRALATFRPSLIALQMPLTEEDEVSFSLPALNQLQPLTISSIADFRRKNVSTHTRRIIQAHLLLRYSDSSMASHGRDLPGRDRILLVDRVETRRIGRDWECQWCYYERRWTSWRWEIHFRGKSQELSAMSY
jgi:hypothetical protein